MINPIRAVGQLVLRALVRGIVIVIEGEGRDACATGLCGKGTQPVQMVVWFARRHPRRADLLERNLAHQRRIRNKEYVAELLLPSLTDCRREA